MWIVNRLILSPQSLVTNSWQWMLQGHTSLWMEEDILLDDLVNPAKSSSRHHRHQIHWTWSWAETRTSTHFSTGTLSHSSTFQDLRRLKLENPIFTSSVQSSMAIGTHTGFITISIFGSSMISVTLKIKTTLEAKFFIHGLKITCRQLSVGGKQTSAQPSKQQSVPCVKNQINAKKTTHKNTVVPNFQSTHQAICVQGVGTPAFRYLRFFRAGSPPWRRTGLRRLPEHYYFGKWASGNVG